MFYGLKLFEDDFIFVYTSEIGGRKKHLEVLAKVQARNQRAQTRAVSMAINCWREEGSGRHLHKVGW